MKDNSLRKGGFQNPVTGDNEVDERKDERVIGGVIRHGESVYVSIRKSMLTPD